MPKTKTRIASTAKTIPAARRAGKATAAASPKPTMVPRASAVALDAITNRWTFLSNHAHVLIALYTDPDLVLREVALQVGITERGVQRIVQDLEDEGFIRREKVGRKNHYQVLVDQPLRHPLEAHRNIGDLLRLVSG